MSRNRLSRRRLSIPLKDAVSAGKVVKALTARDSAAAARRCARSSATSSMMDGRSEGDRRVSCPAPRVKPKKKAMPPEPQ
jgi:hypothetical protein